MAVDDAAWLGLANPKPNPNPSPNTNPNPNPNPNQVRRMAAAQPAPTFLLLGGDNFGHVPPASEDREGTPLGVGG